MYVPPTSNKYNFTVNSLKIGARQKPTTSHFAFDLQS